MTPVATLHPSRREVGDQPSPLAIDLQPMRRRHIPQVLEIERRVYPRPWTMTLFLSEIVQRSTRFYIVARLRRRVVGYAGLMVFGDEAHVTNIAVAPDLHRRKVASRLLFALVPEARRRGATACTLEVTPLYLRRPDIDPNVERRLAAAGGSGASGVGPRVDEGTGGA